MDEEKKPEDMPSPEPSNVEVADEANEADLAAAFGHDDEPVVEESPTNPDVEPEISNSTEPEKQSVVDVAKNPSKAKKINKKYVIAGVAVIAAFAVGIGTMWALGGGTKNNSQSTNNSTQVQKIEETKPAATPVSATVVWLDAPKKLAMQPVFADQWFKDSFDGSTNLEELENFYQVGSIGTDQIIIAHINNGIGSQTILLKKSGESYTLYQQHSPNAFYANTEGGEQAYQGPTLRPGVKIDKSSQFTDIVPAAETKIKGQAYNTSKYGAIGVDFIDTKEPTSRDSQLYIFVEDTPAGKVYEVVSREDPTYRVSYYTLMTKDHRMHPYIISSDLFVAGTPAITWTDGNKKNTAAYRSAVGGCGFSDANEVAKNFYIENLEVIGTAANGQKIYSPKSTSDALFVKHYNEYKEVATYNDTLAADEKNMTIAEFKKHNGFYAAQDVQGRWIVMSNEKYIPGGGCAKPVVYLYPTVATLVNVGVGADVTVSDPYYPTGGWKSVLAQPNGKLSYQGKAYGSLFWEGYGHGAYPTISSGYFVKRSAVEASVRSDLAKQGLIEHEINDFWDFWQTKLPAKEYVRITWLSKQELQTLAPLYVTPKPDTTIRVFLDMEGTDAPYMLAPQKLLTPKRNGFTVVEWGGLARDGSVPKLR